MCLLLVCVCRKADGHPYKAVIVSNRDELMDRPAKSAHFWENLPDVLGGMDVTAGKQGGTWLAACRNGRIGVLLNVNAPGAVADDNKKSRGFLVPDYLCAPSSSEHFNYLESQGTQYNPFHLVGLNIHDPDHSLRHYSNYDGKTTVFDDGFYGFCNSTLEKPYLKATIGRSHLQTILSEFGSQKDRLVENLLLLLQDEEVHPEDSLLSSTLVSSICVRIPGNAYGTRTHTIILIDHQNKLDFYEWTLRTPIINHKLEYDHVHHSMQL